MLPTISSSKPSSRRQGSRNRPKIGRSASSALIGAIKNIVTAPLSWFTSTDDFEQDPDMQGKRRRAAETKTAAAYDERKPVDAVEEGIAPRVKRMRVHSPDRHAYLDPPSSVFSRNTASPSRNSLPRTMSIDPQPISRGVSMSALPELSPGPFSFRTISRDLSLPPASPSRIGFRSRTALTPQPSQQQFMASDSRRDVSEPPPITSLMEHPAFVHPPQAEQPTPRKDTLTLGHLAEYRRESRSPSRYSLLFPPGDHSNQPQYATTSRLPPPRAQTPVQKALHDLDIYKTPLVPSRLRATTPSLSTYDMNSLVSHGSNANVPDLFKKRPPIIMNDRERRSGGKRKGRDNSDEFGEGRKKKEINETKPYAGEGGMKKLLARRKAEEEALGESRNKTGKGKRHNEDASDEDDEMSDVSASMQKPQSRHVTKVDKAAHTDASLDKAAPAAAIVPPLPSKPPTDWYTAASKTSSTTSSGSSLRVGRNKASRNHIARPTAPVGRRPNRFSAAYDDTEREDDSMDGSKAEDSERARQEELAELESAAKNAPVFNIPAGFSFAKEAPPLSQPDSQTADPPIAALPFSLAKPNTTAKNSMPTDDTAVNATATQSDAKATPPPAFQVPPVASVSSAKPADLAGSSKGPGPTTSGGIPNFFTKSSALSKPVVAAAPISGFNLGPSPAPSAPATPPVAASEPMENPFAPAEASKPEDTSSAFNFGTAKPAETSTSTSFGGFNLNQGSTLKDADAKATDSSATSNLFGGFGAGGGTSNSLFGPSSSSPSLPFSFGKPATETSSAMTAAPSVGEQASTSTSNAVKDASSAPFSFGKPPVTTSNPVAETKAESSSGFTFGPPAGADATPKPVFGAPNSASLFASMENKSGSNAAPTAPTAASSTPFSFGSTPATPPPAPEKKPAFTFGIATPTATTPSASAGFSFGGGGSAASDVSNKPPGFGFGFGTPVSLAPGARPSTPPRPAQDDDAMRMEESPTREVQVSANAEQRPTLGTGASFSFSGMNSNNSTSSPFSFGVPQSTPSTLFGGSQPTEKPQEPAKSLFSFGTSSTPTPSTASPSPAFSFGQPKAPDPPQANASSGFPFSTPTSASTTPAPFAFGAPSATQMPNSTNPFGAASGTAPGSPSTFSQPAPFSFGTSAQSPVSGGTAASSQPFAFGSSQPASPAAGNTNLPQASGGFGTGAPAPTFGGGGAAPGGQSLFTIGAPPSAAPGPPGQRQIKKLPRRPGAKR